MSVKNRAQYRNEWKYICPNAMLEELEYRLAYLLSYDEYGDDRGRYTVHSLYFDDLYDSCARGNESGCSSRYKYRIRYYNDNKEYLRLEKKEKLEGRCRKQSVQIDSTQYDLILDGDYSEVLWNTDNPILKKFCIDCMSRGFRAREIVEYDRVAFADTTTNVRITFDQNISVSNEVTEFLTQDYINLPLQDKDVSVLEVKFDDILPSYIRHLVTDKRLVQDTFSKYYNGRRNIQNRGRM